VFLKVYAKGIDGKASQLELSKVERFTKGNEPAAAYHLLWTANIADQTS
jgi:hypothetical protein